MAKLTRAMGNRQIDAVFSSLNTGKGIYASEDFDYIAGMAQLKREVKDLLKLTSDPEYRYWLNNLDISEYTKYFKKITELAETFRLQKANQMKDAEFVTIGELSEKFNQETENKTRLELLSTFTLDDYKQWNENYEQKETMLRKILENGKLKNDGEQTINSFLQSFSSDDRRKFIENCSTDSRLLTLIINNIKGPEKIDFLKLMLDFTSDIESETNDYIVPKERKITVAFVDGKIYLNEHKKTDDDPLTNEYELVKQQVVSPFQNITYCYGDEENVITVPAIVLIKETAVLYDDYFKGNIIWAELSENQKKNIYTEFVLHYLPSEIKKLIVDNPLTFIIMMIVGYAIGNLSVFLAACMAIIGTIGSIGNIIEGYTSIKNVVESYNSINDINEAKKSAKLFAYGLTLLGVEIIPVIFGLIKRGVAKYKGRELRLGETVKQNPKVVYSRTPDNSKFAKNAVDIIENNNQFKWNDTKGKWTSADGNREIWFDKVWKYSGENGTVDEFTVFLTYSKSKGTTPTQKNTNKSFMQGHHGIQNDWAQKRINDKFGDIGCYDKNEAPSILLRDSCTGTPHRYITNLQKNRLNKIYSTDYIDQRQFTISELSEIGCPQKQIDSYLSLADKYYRSIYQKIKNEILKLNIEDKQSKLNDLEDIFGGYFN